MILRNELEVTGLEDGVAFDHVSSDDNSEESGDAAASNRDISRHQQVSTDELADSGDDIASGTALLENSIRRRKLRMILDFEDDE